MSVKQAMTVSTAAGGDVLAQLVEAQHRVTSSTEKG